MRLFHDYIIKMFYDINRNQRKENSPVSISFSLSHTHTHACTRSITNHVRWEILNRLVYLNCSLLIFDSFNPIARYDGMSACIACPILLQSRMIIIILDRTRTHSNYIVKDNFRTNLKSNWWKSFLRTPFFNDILTLKLNASLFMYACLSFIHETCHSLFLSSIYGTHLHSRIKKETKKNESYCAKAIKFRKEYTYIYIYSNAEQKICTHRRMHISSQILLIRCRCLPSFSSSSSVMIHMLFRLSSSLIFEEHLT